jgi:pyridoxal biosynthesis lyase PdxS
MAEMLKGGVIMDVVNVEQAKIAEDSGAVAVMALERVPADIRAQGGVARMSDPDMIAAIQAAVSIPVMAKARIGHFVEAQVLESFGSRITSTSLKFSRPPITKTISISGSSPFHLSVAQQISARRSVASMKVPQ